MREEKVYIVTAVNQDTNVDYCPLETRLYTIFRSLFGDDNVTLGYTSGHFIIFNSRVQIYIEKVGSSGGTDREGTTRCVTLNWDNKIAGLNRVVDCILLVLLSVDGETDNEWQEVTTVMKPSGSDTVAVSGEFNTAQGLFEAQFGSTFSYDVTTDTAVIGLDGGKTAKIKLQSMEVVECNSPPLRGRIDNLFTILHRLRS